MPDNRDPIAWKAIFLLLAVAAGCGDTTSSIDGPRQNRPQLSRPAADNGDPAQQVASLVKDLRSAEEEVASAAHDGLLAVGEPCVPALAELLGTADEESSPLHSRVAKLLGEIGGPEALGPLVGSLEESGLDVSFDVVHAIGEIGDPSSVSALAGVLEEIRRLPPWEKFGHGGLRRAALIALGKIDSRLAVLVIQSELVDHSLSAGATVDGAAAAAITFCQSKRAVEVLMEVLDDPGLAHEAFHVVTSLCRIGTPEARLALVRLLAHPNPSVRSQAAEGLAYARKMENGFPSDIICKDPAVVPPLLGALKDEDPTVRAKACEALGAVGFRRATPALIERLSDDDPVVRKEAAGAFVMMRDRRAIPALSSLADDEAWEVRKVAAMAIGRLGDPKGLESLHTFLTDDKPAVRRNAILALGLIGGDDALDRLQALDVGEDPMRSAAIRGALWLANRPYSREELLEALTSDDVAIWAAAIELMRQEFSIKAASLLREAQGKVSAITRMDIDETLEVLRTHGKWKEHWDRTPSGDE